MNEKSVLHFLAKDFELESLEQIPEREMFGVNIVWIIYFAIKLITKIIGMIYLDFNTLYWLVFLLGDPMTIMTVVLSIVIIRIHYKKDSLRLP